MIITYLPVMFGADPEFFFEKKGHVIGAEKVLPKEGVEIVVDRLLKDDGTIEDVKKPIVIIDGVQAEFNVIPATCRQTFSANLIQCFIKAKESMGSGVTANFGQTVEITSEEMKSLSEKAQQFGCAPSKNAYSESKIAIKDASKYMYRSAGGHIHLGKVSQSAEVFTRREDLVRMLDILVGNTCVLIDRDPGNIERRKVYGRAGEYRLPKHGLEYRTLSNFWLRSYQLTSFVLALSRFAVCVTANKEASDAILARVDMKDIRRAINDNDFDLAYKNFSAIKEVIASIGIGTSTYFPLEGKRIEYFEVFITKPMQEWFPDEPMVAWLSPHATYNGWERFIDNIVPSPHVEPNQPDSPMMVYTYTGLSN